MKGLDLALGVWAGEEVVRWPAWGSTCVVQAGWAVLWEGVWLGLQGLQPASRLGLSARQAGGPAEAGLRGGRGSLTAC